MLPVSLLRGSSIGYELRTLMSYEKDPEIEIKQLNQYPNLFSYQI